MRARFYAVELEPELTLETLTLSSSDQIELHAEQYGKGAPIVFSHGFGGSARNFRRQARELESNHQVLLYDARGHARSGAPREPEAYEPERFIDDLAMVSGRARQPIVAAGLSMGAGTSLRFALRHPELVRALVLAAPPRGGPEQRAWALAFADAIEQHGIEAAGAVFAWGGRSRFDAKGADFIRQGFLEHQPHALVHVLRRVLAQQASAEELSSELATSAVPALIVAGSNDLPSLEAGQLFAQQMRDARLVVIQGAGHVVNLAAPGPFRRALREFLSSLDARS